MRNDYVPVFLDEFLEEGGLFIATDGARVIGMVKYTRCLGGDGWLGAARTDPRYRRQGVTTAIVRECARYGASQGARHLRLWSLRTNRPAQITVRSMGFREVGTFRRVRKRVTKKAGKSQLTVMRDARTAWSLIRRSSILKESSGYAATGTEFVKVNANVVAEAVRAGKLLHVGENVFYLDDKAWGGSWPGVVEFTPLAGDVELLIREAELSARERRMKEIHAYVPIRSRTLRTAKRMGFKVVSWGREAVLFEKAIRPSRHI